jgi:hypothetical protein
MNTKDFLRLGVPLGQATRLAMDFISKFILGGGASGSAEFIPLQRAAVVRRWKTFMRAGGRELKRRARRAPVRWQRHALRLAV